MKEGIHPDYHEIKIVMTDGTEYTTHSCWGKPGDVMRLDIDPKTHPAWTGGAVKVLERGQLSRFNKRYGDLGAPSEAKKEEKKKAEKETA